MLMSFIMKVEVQVCVCVCVILSKLFSFPILWSDLISDQSSSWTHRSAGVLPLWWYHRYHVSERSDVNMDTSSIFSRIMETFSGTTTTSSRNLLILSRLPRGPFGAQTIISAPELSHWLMELPQGPVQVSNRFPAMNHRAVWMTSVYSRLQNLLKNV